MAQILGMGFSGGIVKDGLAIELFDKVSDTAHNLDRMLAKLQAVSQIASTELISREISFDMELDLILGQYRNSIAENQIKVERQLRVGKTIKTFPSLVRIIIENIIENSINFASPENPVINILIERNENLLTIRVEDNGEGIDKEFHDRLFEMYFRANERSKGNGLGLYLVKKATEKLNGTVTYAPNLPAGSIFTVNLPI